MITEHQIPYSLNYRFKKILNLFGRYLILILVAFFFLFPIIFMFVSSIKNNESQIIRDMSNIRAFIPYGELGIKNYLDVFDQMPFGRFMFNSVFIVSSTVLGGLFVNSMLAYSLARLRFKGRQLILTLVIALIIIPTEAVVIPLLLMVNRIGWLIAIRFRLSLLSLMPFRFSSFINFLLVFLKVLMRQPESMEQVRFKFTGELSYLFPNRFLLRLRFYNTLFAGVIFSGL
jgi:multiple sugar transport system permease protein